MIHPYTELRFISDEIGFGVFASKFIPKGTIVYVKDELEILVSPEKYEDYSPLIKKYIDRYSYIDDQGVRIVSWDHAKYVNHCCDCNTISTGYGFEIAIKDIQAGDQITDEYGIFNIEQDFPLICDKTCCRKMVKKTDFDDYFPQWDQKIKESLRLIQTVSQPLYDFIENEEKMELENYLTQRSEYKSILRLKCDSNKVKI